MENFTEKLPVAVFVTALMPGLSLNISTLFQEDVTLATMLMRPLHLCNIENMQNKLIFSRKKYGSIRRVFIVSEKDKVGKEDFQRWMIEKNPPDEVEEIRGTNHKVMMSKPLELCDILNRIAGKYS
ncbi:hypothetical protein Vadar_019867 [Vaccinium darrowii]|uniref:Uncharacterized protein n=1 Tax=Vaccinium darrowii TaxID=229202 RepID=A0ACB7YPA1_9ERIC|nr:hypothetical protein Vadar_019867 [Vaccinium darrowii]